MKITDFLCVVNYIYIYMNKIQLWLNIIQINYIFASITTMN